VAATAGEKSFIRRLRFIQPLQDSGPVRAKSGSHVDSRRARRLLPPSFRRCVAGMIPRLHAVPMLGWRVL